MAVPEKHRQHEQTVTPICLRCGDMTRQVELVSADGARHSTARCPRCANHSHSAAQLRP